MVFKKIISNFHLPKWLFLLLIAVIILRIPSFFEPYSYGDEMIYLNLGEAIRQGIPLYKEIHDNKPPLLYLTAALAGSLFWFKVILAFWQMVTIFLFWKLTKTLFPKKAGTQTIATIIFSIFTTIPLLEGNIVNAELFMIGPIILAFTILLTKPLIPKNLICAGVLFSLATLFKVPAAFDLPVIIFFWILTAKKLDKKSIVQISKSTTFLLIGFCFPILLTFIWYFLHGAFSEYLIAAYLQNFGYLSSWRPEDVQSSFLIKNLPLISRMGVVGLGFVLLYLKRNKLSKRFLFLTTWLLFSLFAVTLSERPYPHYLIQSVPSLVLLLTIFFTDETVEQSLTIIPLALAFFVPIYFNFWYYPTAPYYVRFFKLGTGQVSKNDYLKTFGGEVKRNYQISEFLVSSTKKDEKIFIWGDGPSIYALSRRLPPIKYVADYHIKDFSSETETLEALRKNKPKMIIILPNSSPFPDLLNFVNRNYLQLETIDGAQIWNLLNSRSSF